MERKWIEIGGESIDYFKNWESVIVEDSGNKLIDETMVDNVLIISLADYENRLELRFGQEVYAEDIGLIYRELRILDSQCFNDCDNISWDEKAEKGHIFIQKAIL